MKNILFAASECVPFIKTGGLADVVGSLPKDFDKEKYDVRVVIPNYMCMKQEWKEKLEYVAHFYMDIAGQDRYVGVLKIELNGIIFFPCCHSFTPLSVPLPHTTPPTPRLRTPVG